MASILEQNPIPDVSALIEELRDYSEQLQEIIDSLEENDKTDGKDYDELLMTQHHVENALSALSFLE